MFLLTKFMTWKMDRIPAALVVLYCIVAATFVLMACNAPSSEPDDLVKLLSQPDAAERVYLMMRHRGADYVVQQFTSSPEDLDFVEALRTAAGRDDPVGDAANFGLFRMEEDAELRITTLLSAMHDREREDLFVVGELLRTQLDPRIDSPYVSIMLESITPDQSPANLIIKDSLEPFTRSPEGVLALLHAAEEGEHLVRNNAVSLLGRVDWSDPRIVHPEARPVLNQLLTDDFESLRTYACLGLRHFGHDRDSYEALLNVFESDNSDGVRAAAIDVLADVGVPREITPLLREAQDDPNPDVRAAAAGALSHLRARQVRNVIFILCLIGVAGLGGYMVLRWRSKRIAAPGSRPQPHSAKPDGGCG